MRRRRRSGVEDGRGVYFHTGHSMSPADTGCGRTDFYEHSDTGNGLVTVGRRRRSPLAPARSTATPTFDLVPATRKRAQCRIDQDAYKPCSSTFTQEINDGEHVLLSVATRNRSAIGVADRRFMVETITRRRPLSPTGPPTAGTSRSRPVPADGVLLRIVGADRPPRMPLRRRFVELCDQSSRRPAQRALTARTSRCHRSALLRGPSGGWQRDRRPDPGPPRFHRVPLRRRPRARAFQPGVPGSLRSLAAGGLAPVVRCSKSCQVAARVTLRSKLKASSGRWVRQGHRGGGPRRDSDRRQAVVRRKAGAAKGEAGLGEDRTGRNPVRRRWRRSNTDPHGAALETPLAARAAPASTTTEVPDGSAGRLHPLSRTDSTRIV